MEPPRPTPILAYSGDQPFGWREEDGDMVLAISYGPSYTPLLEHVAGLMASTFFLVCIVALVVVVTRHLQPGHEAAGFAAVAVGLLAIKSWVLVVMRCVRQARVGNCAKVSIRITEEHLDIGPLLRRGGEDWVCWRREKICGLGMEVVKAKWFQAARVRLFIRYGDSTRDFVWLPWPDGEPVEPHQQYLRQQLHLSGGCV